MCLIEDKRVINVIPMPLFSSTNTIDWLAVGDFVRKPFPDKVVIELVHSHPKQGVVSVFSFGMAFGGLLGCCGALGIIPVLVSPQRWQKAILGEGKHEKQDTIDWVQVNYPGVSLLATKRSRKPHDGLADSIALAYYGSL